MDRAEFAGWLEASDDEAALARDLVLPDDLRRVCGSWSATTSQPVRVRHRVTGVVQGVGFRPHVFRLATGLGLAGHVGNDSDGVVIEVEPPPSARSAEPG